MASKQYIRHLQQYLQPLGEGWTIKLLCNEKNRYFRPVFNPFDESIRGIKQFTTGSIAFSFPWGIGFDERCGWPRGKASESGHLNQHSHTIIL